MAYKGILLHEIQDLCCKQQVMCCLTCQIIWTEQIYSEAQQWHTSYSGLAVSYCLLIVAAVIMYLTLIVLMWRIG